MNEDIQEHIAQIANYIQKQSLQPLTVEALKEALTYPGNDRPALVARIPVICGDIREIKNNLKWLTRLTGSVAVIVGSGLALAIFQKLL